jgi:hypothetical protein
VSPLADRDAGRCECVEQREVVCVEQREVVYVEQQLGGGGVLIEVPAAFRAAIGATWCAITPARASWDGVTDLVRGADRPARRRSLGGQARPICW